MTTQIKSELNVNGLLNTKEKPCGKDKRSKINLVSEKLYNCLRILSVKKKQHTGRYGWFRQEDAHRWACVSMNLHSRTAAQ